MKLEIYHILGNFFRLKTPTVVKDITVKNGLIMGDKLTDEETEFVKFELKL